jgi:hypothetical protein
MAGNAQANLVVNPYSLAGVDTTTRSTVVEGTVQAVVASGATVSAITAFQVATNVLTLTAVNTLTTGGGQIIVVSGFSGGNAYLNGTYTVSSATGTTIVVPLVHADAGPTTAAGIATLQPTYTTGGIPINLGFVNSAGKASPVGTIGPLSVPKWIDFHTIAGSALNYKVDQSATPYKLLIFSGITQATDAAAIPTDTVAFRAEFTKNAF